MRLPWLVLAAFLLQAPVTEAAPTRGRVAKKGKRARAGAPTLEGERMVVRYATEKRAYFARGRRDGLIETREVRAAKTDGCAVEAVADHYARCERGELRAGQAVAFTPEERPPPPEVPRPDAPASRATLAAASRALAEAEQSVVVFDGDSNLRRIAAAGVSHRVWDNLGQAQVSWQRAGVFMSLRDAPLFHERIRANAELYGFQWLDRPGSARFLPERDTQLFVFGLSAQYQGDSWVASAGRFQPRFAPGVLLLDGVQIGAQTLGFDEIGVYGGGYPDLVDVERAIRRWTGGLYYTLRVGDPTDVSVDHAARVAVLQTRADELYYEAQPQVRLRFNNALEVTGEARFGLEAATLDGARTALWLPLGRTVQITGNYRYYSARALENDAISPRALLPASTQHADAAFQWQPSPWLITRATSWYAFDEQTQRQRLMLGPEIELPSALIGRGSLAWGYREELGWLDGRTIYMQAVAEPSSVLNVVGRVSYFSDRYERELGSKSIDEIGIYGNLRWRFTPRFTLELSLLSRAGLSSPIDDGLAEDRLGLSTRFALTGQL